MYVPMQLYHIQQQRRALMLKAKKLYEILFMDFIQFLNGDD